jgi:hypothetical protein
MAQPVILTAWEAKVQRMKVQGQPRQILQEAPSPKITYSKMDWRCGLEVYHSSGRVHALQVQSPKFKPQSHQGRKK